MCIRDRLFIIYDEAMFREVCHECAIGIRVGGKIVHMIRCVDDKAVVASSQKGLQELMNRLNSVMKEFGMKISVKKTKVMCTSRQGKSKVEQVSQFRYFESWISDDGYATEDI